MNAGELRTGDTFVQVPRDEWERMTAREQNTHKRIGVLALLPECRHDTTRVHIRTTAGAWCIPWEAPATIVGGRAEAVNAA